MQLSALYFVLVTLFASSLSEPNIEQSLANFRKALGTKLLAIDVVPELKPPAVLISAPVKPAHTNLGIIQNYLGTETKNETAEAIQGVNNLVLSGILPGFSPITVDNILSPLSESNLNYSGTKKPCHHKGDVVANKDTELRPFSDSHNNNTPLSQTAKPCHNKETLTEKPLSQTESPLQQNKDSTSVSKIPCNHNLVQTVTSTVALNSNSDKVEIIEQRPVLSVIQAAPQLPPWQVPVTGQVIVEETEYIPNNQVTLVQPGLSVSSSSHDCNKDNIEIMERPVQSLIPAATQLPPWQFSANGQILVQQTNYIPDKQVQFTQNVASHISSSAHDCSKGKIEIVERPILSPIPAAPQLPPWQVSANGQIVVEETSYIPKNLVTLAHAQQTIPIPEPPQLPPIWQVPSQVKVEENAYVPNKPCPYKNYDRTNLIYNQGPINLPPVFNNPPVPVNVVPLPVPSAVKVNVPPKVDIPQPVIETIAQPLPLVVDIPSSYTYQQVKGDGSVETTFALEDGVHVRYVPNPNFDINTYSEYSQRPANNFIANNIRSYPYVQSQQYPHIESGINEYNVQNRPYNYNQYPVQQPIPQRPYHPYPGYSNVRPQVNNYHQPGHVHPQSFIHPQHHQPYNLVQHPSYGGGYSYKQIHGDGSITSYHGSDGIVQTLKSESPQLSASQKVEKKPVPQVPFANKFEHKQQSFNVSPYQVIGDATPGYNPMMVQEGINPMYFSYMFKQLGSNGAANDSGSDNKVMSSPAALPVVNTNVRRPEPGLTAAVNTPSNVHVTSYSAYTNGVDISPESNIKSGESAAISSMSNTNEVISEVKPSGTGFKVAYGIGGKTNSKKHSIEYNPIIVLETTTSRSNYYYSQTGSDGFKTEYIGDKDKVVVQNVDDSPKVNDRRKYRGDIPE